MRIHRLEIQAFGPFAQRQVVDFDDLGAQGLFLLNGSTGAGKTSVLDAICYALYGQVPGARQGSVKRLRSDHAPEGLGPEVLCEFSAGGRRLEVRRSPEWMRPAKRGGGTTREQAATQLREKSASGWMVLSQRNDEAGAEITNLLGMSMEQFTKVVMLAQGDFAAFLRASADERQALLQKLFGTEVYKDLEAQLALDAKAAAAAVEEDLARIRGLETLARNQAEDVLAADRSLLADGSDREDLPSVEELQEASGAAVFALLTDALEKASSRAAAALETARREAAGADYAVRAAAECRNRHELRTAAVTEQARLAGMADAVAEWTTSLRDHRAAELLAPVVDAATAAATEHRRADAHVRRQWATYAAATPAAGRAVVDGSEAAGGHDLPSLAMLEAADRELNGQAAVVVAARPDEERLATVTADIAAGEKALAAAEREAAEAAGTERTGRERLAEVHAALTQQRRHAGSLEAARAAVEAAEQTTRAITDHAEQQRLVDDAAAADLLAREAAVAARERWLAAVEHRLSLAAGELAATLRDGESCPVCGSVEHPAPSPLAGTGATAIKEEQAAKRAGDAAARHAAATGEALAEAQRTLAVLADRGGNQDASSAGEALDRARQVLAAATDAAASLLALEEEAVGLDARITAAQGTLAAARATVATVGAANAALDREREALETQLAGLRNGFGSLAERLAALRKEQESTAELISALRLLDAARQTAEDCDAAQAKALAASPFPSAAAVTDALLTASAITDRQDRIEAYRKAQTLNAAALESAVVIQAQAEAAGGAAVPTAEEAAALAESARHHAAAVEEASLRSRLAERALTEVAAGRARHQSLEEALAPLRDRARTLAGLADAVRGAGDNILKMTLSSYVLAARLEQVALAASQRLSTMSDGRYTLSHTDALAGRGRKSGLGLDVVDQWTGQRRDTATLSGGESFMASLSLALGLADVVQQESGGLDIETLFVDEGFGSLDEQSLEQVMDALEGLRDGGRMVGLVSHVAEMKLRITTQLHVHKGRNGSTLSLARVGEAAA